jgi:hypothetical protein
MALERRRPLPVGRYWADIFPQNRAAWQAWLATQTSAGHARLETTSHDNGTGGAPEHDWVLWTTSDETVWPDDIMGFAPNVAGADVTQSSDTAQRPPPEDTDQSAMSTLRAAVMSGAMILGGAIVVGFGLVALSRHRGRRA